MSLRKLVHILAFLTMALLVIPLLLAGPTVLAKPAVQVDTDPADGCTGSWAFPPLYVGGDDGVVFAQAAYEFEENCKPVLVSQVRLNYVPDSALEEQEPFETKTVPIIPPLPPKEDGLGIEAVDTCHLRTWEEDRMPLDWI